MPKGEGSPRIHGLSADLLEDRLLLSHGAGSSVVHVMGGTPAQVAPIPLVTKPTADPGHASSANLGDLQQRDAEAVAAAAQASSTGSNKDQSNLPLILERGGDPEETANNAGGSLASSHNLRVVYSEEHVAWSLGGSAGPASLTIAHDWAEMKPEIPETSPEKVLDVGDSSVDSLIRPEDLHEALGEAVTRGADLLAPYLPVDRLGLEQAIDRLMNGIEILGEEVTGEANGVELIPLPIAWGIGLAVVEIARRRLRSASERDDEPDPDPALGFRGSPG